MLVVGEIKINANWHALILHVCLLRFMHGCPYLELAKKRQLRGELGLDLCASWKTGKAGGAYLITSIQKEGVLAGMAQAVDHGLVAGSSAVTMAQLNVISSAAYSNVVGRIDSGVHVVRMDNSQVQPAIIPRGQSKCGCSRRCKDTDHEWKSREPWEAVDLRKEAHQGSVFPQSGMVTGVERE